MCAHTAPPRTLGPSFHAVFAMGVLWMHLRVLKLRILSSQLSRNRSAKMVLRAGPSYGKQTVLHPTTNTRHGARHGKCAQGCMVTVLAPLPPLAHVVPDLLAHAHSCQPGRSRPACHLLRARGGKQLPSVVGLPGTHLRKPNLPGRARARCDHRARLRLRALCQGAYAPALYCDHVARDSGLHRRHGASQGAAGCIRPRELRRRRAQLPQARRRDRGYACPPAFAATTVATANRATVAAAAPSAADAVSIAADAASMAAANVTAAIRHRPAARVPGGLGTLPLYVRDGLRRRPPLGRSQVWRDRT